MSHHKFHLPNVPVLTCLVTERIPDPRKNRNGLAFKGNVTADSGDVSGGFSSQESHHGRHTPGATAMSLHWLSKIKLSPETQKHLAFPESCLIVSDTGEGIGKMFTSVEVSSWAGTPCLLVHSGSYAKIGPEVDVGTSLTGFITPELKVIHELSHEWSNFHGIQFERKTFLSQEDMGVHCSSTFKRDDVTKYDRVTSIPFIDLKTFISEATNILLQRLIIFEKKSGTITLKALNSQGVSVPIDYRVLGRGIENVKGEKVEVYGIRRSLWSDNIQKAGIAWDSVFSFYGRLVLRCQPEGNEHAMIPLWFRPVEEHDEFGQLIGARPPIIWACDQELYSKYLMKRTELAAQYKTYLMDHPALRSLLSDFMQKLLFCKPKDIFAFAHEYFNPLVKLRQDSPDASDCETTSSCMGSSDEAEEIEEEAEEQDEAEANEEVEGEDEEIMTNILQLHRKLHPLMQGEQLPTLIEIEEEGEEIEPPMAPPPPPSPPTETDLLTSDDEEEEETDLTDLGQGIQHVSEAEEEEYDA